MLFPSLKLSPFDFRPRLPGACLLCSQACWREYSLCQQCESDLPYIGSCCRRCGEERAPASLFEGQCGRCAVQAPIFDSCMPVFNYAAPVDRLIAAFKYHGHFAAGFALANLLATRIRGELNNQPTPQLILPVPLHPRRLRRRGFNQAWELGRILSRQLAIPADPNLLLKIRNTEAQSELAAAARRRRNLRRAFALDETRGLGNVKHVAIIDDVVTTMSTANEIGRVLRGHGIRRLELWCLARARR